MPKWMRFTLAAVVGLAGVARWGGLPFLPTPASTSPAFAASNPLARVADGLAPRPDARQRGLSGFWYDPATSGQGFAFEIYPDALTDGAGYLFGGWFTFDTLAGGASAQRWYSLGGAVRTDAVAQELTIYRNVGGNFALPPSTRAEEVGRATLVFETCTRATLSYHFADGSGRQGEIDLQRLTPNLTCTTTAVAPSNADFALSGFWYDPQLSGQGVFVEINGAAPVAVLAWYTYASDGQTAGVAGQRWYTAQVAYPEGARSVTMPVYQTTGGVFDTPTPPGQATVEIGRATLNFHDCASAVLSYAFDDGGGGSLPLSRLVGTPPDCQLEPERLQPLSGAEPRYLAFQVFEGGADPAIPFDRVLSYTPKAQVAAMVHDIVSTIGHTGQGRAKLAFVLGPIAFDHSDAEVRQIIDDGFSIALAENVAVGFHIDDSMFWSKRSDLYADPADIEWTDFSGTPSTALLLDWASPPAKMCFNAPRIQSEVRRRAREVIGAEIASQVARLTALGKPELFAGVIAGWETHMGQDAVTRERVGFHALHNRGFGPGQAPPDVNAEIAAIVAEFIGLWTQGLAAAGVDPRRIYTHVAFLTRAQHAALALPPELTYEQLVDAVPSTQRPSIAFDAHSRPGFSTYPAAGRFDQIQEERLRYGEPGWASSEGTNLIPPGPFGNSNMRMETWLARHFNHGATLVTVFAWGIGGPAQSGSPFRLATQGTEALEAYRQFLAQPADAPLYTGFAAPVPVAIRGYAEDAMEPFLTRDGRYLFFNNLNTPEVNTELHYAERVDDTTFDYRGPLGGVNTAALEGVPSMDRSGNFYFVSTRSYTQTLALLHRGRFEDGQVSAVQRVPGLAGGQAGDLHFDAEISPDGTTLYFVDGVFDGRPFPVAADLAIAQRQGDALIRVPDSAVQLAAVNSSALEYAPCISDSGRELFFTRYANGRTALYRASRSRIDLPFDAPQRIAGIAGHFVEAPTLAPDERAIYFHQRTGERYGIYRSQR